jgi:hypothetical protein
MTRHGVELMGLLREPDRTAQPVVRGWRSDNLADMERKRSARHADPAWSEFLSLIEGMVLVQGNKIMRPTCVSPVL